MAKERSEGTNTQLEVLPPASRPQIEYRTAVPMSDDLEQLQDYRTDIHRGPLQKVCWVVATFLPTRIEATVSQWALQAPEYDSRTQAHRPGFSSSAPH
jgi:hypothetical protein